MKKEKNSEITLESVRSDLLKWRENKRKQKGLKNIPEELWNRSVILASKYSVAKVAKYLNLTYTHLKQRVHENRSKSIKENTFVELDVEIPIKREVPYSIKAQKINGETIEISSTFYSMSTTEVININEIIKDFFRY